MKKDILDRLRTMISKYGSLKELSEGFAKEFLNNVRELAQIVENQDENYYKTREFRRKSRVLQDLIETEVQRPDLSEATKKWLSSEKDVTIVLWITMSKL